MAQQIMMEVWFHLHLQLCVCTERREGGRVGRRRGNSKRTKKEGTERRREGKYGQTDGRTGQWKKRREGGNGSPHRVGTEIFRHSYCRWVPCIGWAIIIMGGRSGGVLINYGWKEKERHDSFNNEERSV